MNIQANKSWYWTLDKMPWYKKFKYLKFRIGLAVTKRTADYEGCFAVDILLIAWVITIDWKIKRAP